MSLILWRPEGVVTSLGRTMGCMLRESMTWPLYEPFSFFGDDEHFFMPIDIEQTKDSVVVKASLPGVKLEEIDISVTDNVLTLKGETKAEEETKEAEYVYKESFSGEFSRSMKLPQGLDTEKAEGTMEDGILTLTIPRLEEAKPKSIKVKATSSKKEK